ncbi:MAG: hypothetical protein AB1921_13425 [Thermodesulfobacteriota bacterium]
MKQIVVDQLRPGDRDRIEELLTRRFGESPLPGIYWVPLPEDALSPVQEEHPDCAPFVIALEVSETALSCELLVRSRQRMRCSCVAYATEGQVLYLLRLLDGLLGELGIAV